MGCSLEFVVYHVFFVLPLAASLLSKNKLQCSTKEFLVHYFQTPWALRQIFFQESKWWVEPKPGTSCWWKKSCTRHVWNPAKYWGMNPPPNIKIVICSESSLLNVHFFRWKILCGNFREKKIEPSQLMCFFPKKSPLFDRLFTTILAQFESVDHKKKFKQSLGLWSITQLCGMMIKHSGQISSRPHTTDFPPNLVV